MKVRGCCLVHKVGTQTVDRYVQDSLCADIVTCAGAHLSPQDATVDTRPTVKSIVAQPALQRVASGSAHQTISAVTTHETVVGPATVHYIVTGTTMDKVPTVSAADNIISTAGKDPISTPQRHNDVVTSGAIDNIGVGCSDNGRRSSSAGDRLSHCGR